MKIILVIGAYLTLVMVLGWLQAWYLPQGCGDFEPAEDENSG